MPKLILSLESITGNEAWRLVFSSFNTFAVGDVTPDIARIIVARYQILMRGRDADYHLTETRYADHVMTCFCHKGLERFFNDRHKVLFGHVVAPEMEWRDAKWQATAGNQMIVTIEGAAWELHPTADKDTALRTSVLPMETIYEIANSDLES